MHLSPTLLIRAKAKHILHWLVAHYWARGLLLPARLIRAHLGARHPAERHHPRGGRAIVVLYVQGASGRQPDRLPARPPSNPPLGVPPLLLPGNYSRLALGVYLPAPAYGSMGGPSAPATMNTPDAVEAPHHLEKPLLTCNLNAAGKPAIPIC